MADTPDLTTRAAKGLGWMVFWRIGTRLLGLGSTLILVKLLGPADFGLIALAVTVTQGVELLSLIGVEEAVIRHPNPTRVVYDTAFTLNVSRGLITALGLVSAAWPAAIFFDEPRLVPVVLVLAVSAIIGGLENIGMAEFRRNLSYAAEFRLRIFPRFLSIIATIVVAFLLHDYRALLVGMLTNKLLSTALSYRLHPHRPRFTVRAWRELVGFSTWIWVISLIAIIRDRVEVIVIGRSDGTAGVGIWSIAVEIAILPMTELMQPLSSVLFAAYSRAADDTRALVVLFQRFFGLTALITLPAGIGIALLAEPIVHIVLGPNWLSTIQIIQAFSVFNIIVSFIFVANPLLQAKGKLYETFKITAFVTVVRALVVVIGVWQFGLIGALAGTIIAMPLNQVLILRVCCRLIEMPVTQLWPLLWRPLLACSAMGYVLISLGFHTHIPGSSIGHAVLRIAVGAAAGVAVYTLAITAAWVVAGRPMGAERDLFNGARLAFQNARTRLGYGRAQV